MKIWIFFNFSTVFASNDTKLCTNVLKPNAKLGQPPKLQFMLPFSDENKKTSKNCTFLFSFHFFGVTIFDVWKKVLKIGSKLGFQKLTTLLSFDLSPSLGLYHINFRFYSQKRYPYPQSHDFSKIPQFHYKSQVARFN